MGAAAIPAVMAISAAAQTASTVAAARGAKQQSSVGNPPEVTQALQAGVGSATAGLNRLPFADITSGLDAYERTQKNFEELQVPDVTIRPQEMAENIGRTTEKAYEPVWAEERRNLAQEAGAFGPTTDTRDVGVRMGAQRGNILAQLMAQIMPQLEETKFNQQLQQLQSALGLGQARIGAGVGQADWVSNMRNQLTSQLLGVGQQGTRLPLQTVTPAWTSALGSVGSTIGSIPTTMSLLDYLKKEKTSLSPGGASGDMSGNLDLSSSSPSLLTQQYSNLKF
jgi:hypothetical protein